MNRIRDLRIAMGWNQEELGRALNVGKGAVSRYEKELRQLDPALICSLCDIFGCSADYLLGRSDSPRPVLSAEDSRLLAQYHAAPENIRAAISVLLAGSSESLEKKKAV